MKRVIEEFVLKPAESKKSSKKGVKKGRKPKNQPEKRIL